MNIREAEKSDLPQVEAIAKKNNLTLPNDGTLLVVVNSNNNVRAFANMRGVIMIEPFASETPQASDKLWTYITEESKRRNVPILRCFVDDKRISLLEKLGFYKIFKKLTAMEINFHT